MTTDPTEEHSSFLKLPRRKPFRLSISLAARGYRVARRVLPARWLARLLLEAARLTRSLAWEQIWFWLPPGQALALSRPDTLNLVTQWTPPGSKVIDLGAGTGVVARAVASMASTVLVVDVSEEHLVSARRLCADCPNVRFATGDLLSVLEEQEPFDVALLLHVIGYFDDPIAALERVRRRVHRLILEVPDFGADALNTARLREHLPAWSDAGYVVEFDAHTLEACLAKAKWTIRQILPRHGQLFALAEAGAPDSGKDRQH